MVKNDYICNMEIWKDVVGYEGYYKVSSLGNVKSLSRKYEPKERILKNCMTAKGYYDVGLSKNNKRRTRRVHKLVAESFLNHKPCGMELVINHIDFNKTNNNVKNLEIVTNRVNGNRKHLKSTSKYTGVYWNKQRNKWQSGINVNGKTKYLGRFDCETSAHLAYEKELKIILS